jgi:hypothetical protein
LSARRNGRTIRPWTHRFVRRGRSSGGWRWAEELARGEAAHDGCGFPLIVGRDGAFHAKVETALA